MPSEKGWGFGILFILGVLVIRVSIMSGLVRMVTLRRIFIEREPYILRLFL